MAAYEKNKDTHFQVRMSCTQKTKLENLARNSGIKPSEYIRRMIDAEAGIAGADDMINHSLFSTLEHAGMTLHSVYSEVSSGDGFDSCAVDRILEISEKLLELAEEVSLRGSKNANAFL